MCIALSSLPDVEQLPSRFGSRRNPAWSVNGRAAWAVAKAAAK